MEAATNKLRRTRLFANLPDRAVAHLLEQPGITIGAAGMPVQARQGDLVVILEGGLVMSSEDGEYQAAFAVATGAREPAILYTIPANAHLELLERSIYVVIAKSGAAIRPTMMYASSPPLVPAPLSARKRC